VSTREPEVRTPGRLRWERCGRGYVAWIGDLTFSISVEERGSQAAGTRYWRVGEVLGNHQLGSRLRHSLLEAALLEAEAVFFRHAPAIARELDTSKRSRATHP
jgi:hypothetical protein